MRFLTRLQRIREKLVKYNMTVKWVPGKSHFIADALSRAPLFSPPSPDEDEFTINTARSCLTQVVEKNHELKLILDSLDSDYIQFRQYVVAGSASSVYSSRMKSVFDQLSADDDLVYLDGNRIVLPNGAIKQVLALLHTSHAGVKRTYEMAHWLYFWPGMLNDVKQLVEGCLMCRKYRPSQPVNKRTTPAPSSYLGPPMGHIGVDLFDFGGSKFLVCVDQWSGYPVFKKLISTATSSILKTLSGWFNILGWPRSIRSDGGPQFRGEFSSFCEKNNIKHELSAPYNPRSNGLAESAVKMVKNILKKCSEENGDPERALYEWRNLPMCPLPLQTHIGFGQPMVAGPVFLPPCFPVPIQVPSLPGGYSSYRFPSSPLSPTSPPSLPVESQDAAGRLLPTGHDRPSLIQAGSKRSSRTGLCDQELPSVRPGGECHSPTPNKKSRLELLLPVEAALLPQPAGESSGQGSGLRMKNKDERIVPSASIQDYNAVSDNRPGNVYNMRVRF